MAGPPMLNETVVVLPVPILLGVCAVPVVPNPDFTGLQLGGPLEAGSAYPSTKVAPVRNLSAGVCRPRLKRAPGNHPTH